MGDKTVSINKMIRFYAIALSVNALIACSNGGSNGGGGGGTSGTSALTMSAPTIVQTTAASAAKASDGNATAYNTYVIISNDTAEAATGLTYDISDKAESGIVTTLAPNQCNIIPSHNECTVTIGVTNTNGVSSSFRLNMSKVGKFFASRVVGVQSASYDTKLPNADGIVLSYKELVLKNIKYLVMTGVVQSAEVRGFNQAFLVDGITHHRLEGQKVLSANLTPGGTLLSQGTSFTIAYPVPKGISQIAPFAKLEIANVDTNNKVLSQYYSRNSFSVAALENQGIIRIVPPRVNLSREHPEQVITIYNNGDTIAALNDLTSDSESIVISQYTPGKSLAVDETMVVKVALKNPNTALKPTTLTLNYHNGKVNRSQSATITANLSDVNSVIPVLSSNQFFTTTAIGHVSSILTLQNDSNAPAYNFEFVLPNNFTISADGSVADECMVQGNKIINTIAPGKNCSVEVTYTNNKPTSETKDKISFTYQYGSGNTTSDSLPITYQVTQDAAPRLSLTPTSADFGTIANDGESQLGKVFVLSNEGGASAAISLGIVGESTNAYTLVNAETNPCSDALAANSKCNIGVQFGPTTVAGVKDAQLIVNSGAESISASLHGNVTAGARISVAAPVATDFKRGDGSESNPYSVEQNTAATLSYTFKNTSEIEAQKFYVSKSGDADDWIMGSNSCGVESSPKALPGNSECTVVYTINSANVAAHDIKLTAKWVDTAEATLDTPTTFVNVFATPSITVNTTSVDGAQPWDAMETLAGDQFKVNFTLVGGVDEPDTKVSIGAAPAAGISYSADSCVVNSAAPQCSIVVTLENNVKLAKQYTAALSNDRKLAQNKSELDFSAYAQNVVMYTLLDRRDGEWFKLYRDAHPDTPDTPESALKVADNWCQQYATNPDFESDFPIKKYRKLKYRALMESNNATTVGVTYYRSFDGLTKIATATNGSLVGIANLESAIRSDPAVFPLIGREVDRGMAFTGAPVDDSYLPQFRNQTCNNWSAPNNQMAPGAGFAYYESSVWYQHKNWSGIVPDFYPITCARHSGLYCVSQN